MMYFKKKNRINNIGQICHLNQKFIPPHPTHKILIELKHAQLLSFLNYNCFLKASWNILNYVVNKV